LTHLTLLLPFHLDRYVDEQAFRFNNRKDADGNKLTDAERFQIAASQIVGKRLTFCRGNWQGKGNSFLALIVRSAGDGRRFSQLTFTGLSRLRFAA
jgi:hypothetical protein